jgi:hypothetical protein
MVETVRALPYIIISSKYAKKSYRDKQHIAMVLGLSGNLFPDPDVVEAILRPAEGERKRVLDLG